MIIKVTKLSTTCFIKLADKELIINLREPKLAFLADIDRYCSLERDLASSLYDIAVKLTHWGEQWIEVVEKTVYVVV